MIKSESGKWSVYSADGSKRLGGPYDTEDEAKKRLAQVEAFKHDSSFAVGDRVTVRAGKEHDADPMMGGKGNPGTIKIVDGTALGVLFDGATEVHKWYVAEELQPAGAQARGDRVMRYDAVGQLRSPRRTEQGRLRVDGVFTRAGIFEYRKAGGGVQRELRPPEEVSRRDSLASLEMLPVVEDHPVTGLLGGDARRAQGWTLEGVRMDGDLVVGSLMVTDPALVKSVEQGKRALSVGYEVEYDPTPGTHPLYGRYDGVQRAIRGDHLAVVDLGRAGPEARVRMDSAGTFATSMPSPLTDVVGSGTLSSSMIHANPRGNAEEGVTRMDEVKKLQDALAAATARAEAAEKSLKDVGARADVAEGRVASLEANLVTARKDAESGAEVPRLQAELAIANKRVEDEVKARKDAEDPKRFALAVAARNRLENSARVILRDAFRADLDDRTLMLAAIEKVQGPIADRDNRSDDYIRGRFELAAENYVSTERALSARAVDRVVEASNAVRADDAHTARQKMNADTYTIKPMSEIK